MNTQRTFQRGMSPRKTSCSPPTVYEPGGWELDNRGAGRYTLTVVSSTRPSLADVRRTLRVKWYRSPIDPGLLRQLMKRSDLQGWWQALGVVGYLAGTALLTWHFFAQQQWALFAVSLFAYGTYSCFLGAASHELDHGTVFRTKALNRFFLRLFSLITFFNPDDYALSHTYHHRYTLHPDGDREVVLPQSAALRVLFIVHCSAST